MNEKRRGLGRGLASLIPSSEQPAAVETALATTLPEPKTSPTSWPVVIPDPAAPAVIEPVRPVVPGSVVPGSVVPAEPTPVSRDEPDEPAAPAEPATVHGAFFAELPVDAIMPNPRQPRDDFKEEPMGELVHSIREVGLLQPIVVRQTGADAYELIMGERRLRASKAAGLTTIPAIVRATDDNKMLLDALLENLHRSELNAIEEAAAYDQLLKDFDCTQEELAARIGRSRPQVTNTLRLLRLPPEVQSKLQAGTLSASHARSLLGLSDPEAQIALAKRIIAEELSVRSVEEIVYLQQAEEERNGPAKPKKQNRARAGTRRAAEIDHLETRLKDRFETSVSIAVGQKKGKVIVEFATVEDLERILSVMAPGEERVLARLRSRTSDDAESAAG
ncbi:ParB/RepB/Spo0J family partition protein [Streptodolium elevatio]|uniref:ParB/RepB/Spo0J family partition protein n=1 Tax=Streptodolium elevatio TaxID=3157996 RepID=A0ABV3DSL0_9ACTN